MTLAVCEQETEKSYSKPPTPTSEDGLRTTGERSERETIQLAQAGQAEAFEEIYHTYSRRIYGLCFRMTGNSSLAEDLTQEIFLQVFRKIHTFRAENAFSTWLYRLAVNVVLMRRRVKRLRETPLENHPSDTDISPQREIGRLDMHVAGVVDRVNLKRALTKLPRGYRRIFLLHDVFGYEHHEIAEALGCSVGNSKSQLHKARVRLRHFLQRGSAEA
jgi:RNA polymerase sigma-70 factor (ECF subfamily)